MNGSTMNQDPQAGADEESGEGQGGGFSVCLNVSSDGQLSVSIEHEDQEGTEGEEGSPTPAKNLSDAIEMIVSAVKSGGAMSDAAAQGAFDEAYAPESRQQSPAKRFA